MTDGLTEKHQRFIQSLHKRGPMLLDEILEQNIIARSTLYGLVRDGYLYQLDTLLGRAIVPGPKGRLLLGLTRFYRPRATSTADGLLLRAALRQAAQEGWQFVSKNLRSRIALVQKNDQKMYIIASLNAYSTRSLKNTLKRMGWYERRKLGTAEHLRIYHPYVNRFAQMVKEANSLLEIRPLQDVLPPGTADKLLGDRRRRRSAPRA
jgi:hypothetical protein